MPDLAPLPLPTMMATGVARPRAQGQEITSTAIALERAYPKSAPTKNHTIRVTRAMAITRGTKTPEILSAILAIGALEAEASETIWMIWLRLVSAPTRVAFALRKPDLLMVAAEMLSPAFLSTGIDSPVRADSSTAEVPSRTRPSTGTFSPGRTRKISPTATCSTGTRASFSLPFASVLTTVASLGASFIRLLSASVVRPLE